MRFVKGAIDFSPSQDVPVLELVMNNGILTKKQMVTLLKKYRPSVSTGALDWRLRRLIKVEALKKFLLAGTLLSTYAITEKGLELLVRSLVETRDASLSLKNENDPRLFHTLVVNDIQETFSKLEAFQSWLPEIILAEEFNTGVSRYGKIYDGICELKVGNSIKRIAIEYERSLKNSTAYAEIRKAFEADGAISNFLYITNDINVMMSVRQHFIGIKKNVCFAVLRDVLAAGEETNPEVPVRHIAVWEKKSLLEYIIN